MEIHIGDRVIRRTDPVLAHERIERELLPAHIAPAIFFDGEQAQALIEGAGKACRTGRISSCHLMHLRESGALRFEKRGNAFLYRREDVELLATARTKSVCSLESTQKTPMSSNLSRRGASG